MTPWWVVVVSIPVTHITPLTNGSTSHVLKPLSIPRSLGSVSTPTLTHLDEAHEVAEKSGCKSKVSVSLVQAKNQTNQLANEMLKHYNL